MDLFFLYFLIYSDTFYCCVYRSIRQFKKKNSTKVISSELLLRTFISFHQGSIKIFTVTASFTSRYYLAHVIMTYLGVVVEDNMSNSARISLS